MRRIGWIVAVAVSAVVGGCAAAEGPTSSPSQPTPTSSSTSPAGPPLSLVAIGDSIPFNSRDDCPDCTAFVDQYGDALAKATGRTVEPNNLSDHSGLTLPRLLDDLDSLSEDLAAADAIIVGIAHNSIELGTDAPCGSAIDPATGVPSDWTKIDQACATRSAAASRPRYDELFAKVAAQRAGKPTILIALNKYNDWIGSTDLQLTPDQAKRTIVMHDAWNAMICASAKANQFSCADVYHAFNGSAGEKPSGGLLADDYTHPSQKGNDEISRVLVDLGFAPLA